MGIPVIKPDDINWNNCLYYEDAFSIIIVYKYNGKKHQLLFTSKQEMIDILNKYMGEQIRDVHLCKLLDMADTLRYFKKQTSKNTMQSIILREALVNDTLADTDTFTSLISNNIIEEIQDEDDNLESRVIKDNNNKKISIHAFGNYITEFFEVYAIHGVVCKYDKDLYTEELNLTEDSDRFGEKNQIIRETSEGETIHKPIIITDNNYDKLKDKLYGEISTYVPYYQLRTSGLAADDKNRASELIDKLYWGYEYKNNESQRADENEYGELILKSCYSLVEKVLEEFKEYKELISDSHDTYVIIDTDQMRDIYYDKKVNVTVVNDISTVLNKAKTLGAIIEKRYGQLSYEFYIIRTGRDNYSLVSEHEVINRL